MLKLLTFFLPKKVWKQNNLFFFFSLSLFFQRHKSLHVQNNGSNKAICFALVCWQLYQTTFAKMNLHLSHSLLRDPLSFCGDSRGEQLPQLKQITCCLSDRHSKSWQSHRTCIVLASWLYSKSQLNITDWTVSYITLLNCVMQGGIHIRYATCFCVPC